MNLAELERNLAALPDAADVPNTPREVEAFRNRQRELSTSISALRAAEERVAELDPRIASHQKWIATLVAARQTLCERLLALPERRSREQETELNQLKLSVTCIDRGLDFQMNPWPLPLFALLEAAGFVAPSGDSHCVWNAGHGCLPAAEAYLERIQKDRDAAQATIDRVLAS